MSDAQRPQKVAVVTGGAQGIGKAISLKYCDERYYVIVVDEDREAGEKFIAGNQKVHSLVFQHLDISDEPAVKNLFQQLKEEYGRLDVLVNNAAISSAQNSPLETLSLEEWEQKLSVNLTGVFLCSKHAAPLLRQTGGAIVNIASTRAGMSEPQTEAYSATKGGVVALTHALANSLGPEVRVNAISPGWIDVRAWQKESGYDTPPLRDIDHQQHPAGRVGNPNDVANMVTFLASCRAGFITGQNFVVDGGMSRKMIYAE